MDTGRISSETTYVYVGTFTGPNQAQGLSVFRMDPATGGLTHAHTVTGDGADNPSFLALHPFYTQRPYLYAVNSINTFEGLRSGSVSAFSIEPATGQLTFLNRVASHGRRPIHLSADPSGRYVVVANITEGNVALFPIQPDGRLGEAADVVAHTGMGPNPRRQEGPHPHFITTDPAGVRALSCDLGADRIVVYRLDGAAGQLVPNDLPYAQVSSGAGPRHLAFHSSGRFVYVANELDSTLSAFAYDAERGALQIVHTVSTVPPDFTGANAPAQIVVHPSGRYVYASNRGHDSLVIFGIDQDTGTLARLGYEPTRGTPTRNFNLDPTGAFLLAANQDTNNVVSFRIDQDSGLLAEIGQVETPTPVCIQFATFAPA